MGSGVVHSSPALYSSFYTVTQGSVFPLSVSAGVKDFMCELCGKTFSERTTLETHKLIHTGK